MPADKEENATFTRLRTDVVTKADGRYLIYYSWPDAGGDDRADERAAERAAEGEPTKLNRGTHPAPEPWSPEGGPADV